MKNKLLLSSALVGSLLATSMSFAETKVTGSLDLSYTTRSSDTTKSSADGFGRETQINVSNSGDLNNGMKYAAGFALEFDGGSDGASISNENVFLDVTAGAITFTVGVDHITNTDSSAVPRVSIPANSLARSGTDIAYSQGSQFFTTGNGSVTHVKESMGVGASVGGFHFFYTPSLGDSGGANDSYNTTTNEGSDAYQLLYVGDAGVKGLKINAGVQKAEKSANSIYTTASDVTNTQISASYNFGQVTVGAGRIDSENGTLTALQDKETNDFGITYAVNDKLSLGINYAETSLDTASTVDEEITMLQAGYNLGAVGVAISYMEIQNVEGATGVDNEVASIRLSTKF